MAKKGNWIQAAFSKNKGALHRELGVPPGEKIPKGKLATAAKSNGTLGQRARLVENLAKARSRKKKQK